MSSGNTGNDPSGAGGGNLSMRLLSRGMLAGAGGGPTGDETYLEAFVESLSTLPHELRRNMDLMKDLDASCRCVVNNKQKKIISSQPPVSSLSYPNFTLFPLLYYVQLLLLILQHRFRPSPRAAEGVHPRRRGEDDAAGNRGAAKTTTAASR